MSKRKPSRAADKLRPIVRGMIPSQNAMRFCAAILRRFEATAKRDAIVCIYANDEAGANSLRLQADDCRQVATFLEERIIDQPTANAGQRPDAGRKP